MFDISELQNVTDILENMDDQELAVELLRDFTQRKSQFDQLVANKDVSLDHDQWKQDCDSAQKELEEIVKRIMNCAN